MIVMYADGACRGNPGDGSIGVIILEKESSDLLALKSKSLPVLYAKGEVIGHCTNNIAEYKALLHGLQQLQKMNPVKAGVMMDSQLVIKQMLGEYKVKHPNLKPLYEQSRSIASKLNLTFKYIPREENVLADYLANEALDTKQDGFSG